MNSHFSGRTKDSSTKTKGAPRVQSTRASFKQMLSDSDGVGKEVSYVILFCHWIVLLMPFASNPKKESGAYESDSPPAAVLRLNKKGKQRTIAPPKSDTDEHLSIEEDIELPTIKKVKTRAEADPCVVTFSHHLMTS
jgi:hypothetical protein